MVLNNKLGITDFIKLARDEEKISKMKARLMFDEGKLDTFEVGTFKGLSDIHRDMFGDIYDFAGMIREENIKKACFRFVPVLYLRASIDRIEQMPQSTFDEIVEKYVEMNIAHPFREGNGRSTRIWLDAIFKKELGVVIDWSKIDKTGYLIAMEQSPVKDTDIKTILKSALTDNVSNRDIYMNSIDASYHFAGCNTYKTDKLTLSWYRCFTQNA